MRVGSRVLLCWLMLGHKPGDLSAELYEGGAR
jgi:hypothetical protein